MTEKIGNITENFGYITMNYSSRQRGVDIQMHH
jgi:hypothetical protein